MRRPTPAMPFVLALALLGLALATAAPTQAATVGATVTPSASATCYGESSIQLRSPGMQYAVPFSGVVTSWSYLAAGSPGQLALLVVKLIGEEHTALPGYPYNKAIVQEVGESASVTPPPNLLSTFPTRIPVQAGDLIGLKPSSKGQCWAEHRPEYEMAFGTAPGPGATANFSVREDNETQVDVSARLEPDADGDGYGDETQDQCPANASTQGPCLSTPVPGGGSAAEVTCRVPKLKGKTLKQAEVAIREAHCSLGRVNKPRKSKGKLVVVKVERQGDAVNLTLRVKHKGRHKRAKYHRAAGAACEGGCR
jgi:hypothetical protein